MNLLSTLRAASDEEQLRLQPLPRHAAARQDEHLRRHYALMLAAVLTSRAAVSEHQTRLLRLLLDSLQLGDIRAELFEQTRSITDDALKEALRLIRDAELASHLMVDALVLLRLDTPLDDEATQLATELAAFLGLDNPGLEQAVAAASAVLGVTEADEVARIESDLWPGALRRPLTPEALRRGLHGGLWVLNKDLHVDFPWQSVGATLISLNGAVLRTALATKAEPLVPLGLAADTDGNRSEGELKAGQSLLDNTTLLNFRLEITGANDGRLLMRRCKWVGTYPEPASALVSLAAPIELQHCTFQLKGARAAQVQNAALSVSSCQFTGCGAATLDGGALWHSSGQSFNVIESRFEECVGAKGGAIWIPTMYQHAIVRSEFNDCRSTAWPKDDAATGIAAFSESIKEGGTVIDSAFKRCSLCIGTSSTSNFVSFVIRCRFITADLIYWRPARQNTLYDNCIFTDGEKIECQLD